MGDDDREPRTDESTRALPQVEGQLKGVSLVVVEGPDAGASIAVAADTLIGGSRVCDLVLEDRTVSRRHLRIDPAPLGVRVRDLGSTNGTWIDEARVRDAELPVNGLVRIGGTRLRVEVDAAAAAPAREVPAPTVHSFGRFVGSAGVLQPMYRELTRASASDLTVLIEGESGAGKELLAEAIHTHSHRAEGPFVVVDCGAVSESLVESELFGHEAGAFTGAVRAREGAFEAANGGTVFLDEIGELPLSMQTRLLRVLDRKEIRRLGATERRSVDVRVVAATNRDLDREVEDKRFRLDLFHRLAVVVVRVPPLRERAGDIERLARHLMKAFGGNDEALTERVLDQIRRHDWPGNGRELRNFVERLVLLGEDGTELAGRVGTEKAADPSTSGLPYRQARALALDSFTLAYTEDMLRRHDGNVGAAAEAAGVARRHFQRLKGAK